MGSAVSLVPLPGQVSDLKGHIVTQVAMGKAHTCVLTKIGEVWTFGVNNKGQCGRETGAMNQAGKGNTHMSMHEHTNYHTTQTNFNIPYAHQTPLSLRVYIVYFAFITHSCKHLPYPL